MRKLCIMISMGVLLGVGLTSASFSDGFFCKVKEQQVIISLKKSEGYYGCKDTIASLEQVMLTLIKELQMIDTYIAAGRNISYRTTLRSQKQALLEKLNLSRLAILDNMKIFEKNLVTTSVQYFLLRITPYKIKLQNNFSNVQALLASGNVSSSSLYAYADLLSGQLAVIDAFSRVTTSEEFKSLFTKYVYLKTLLQGKSE